jgi:hypothetical protein
MNSLFKYFSALMLVTLSILATSDLALAEEQPAPTSYSTDGVCVSKDDPNFDVLCSRYTDNYTCNSYPLCRWVDGETIRVLFGLEQTLIEESLEETL